MAKQKLTPSFKIVQVRRNSIKVHFDFCTFTAEDKLLWHDLTKYPMVGELKVNLYADPEIGKKIIYLADKSHATRWSKVLGKKARAIVYAHPTIEEPTDYLIFTQIQLNL